MRELQSQPNSVEMRRFWTNHHEVLHTHQFVPYDFWVSPDEIQISKEYFIYLQIETWWTTSNYTIISIVNMFLKLHLYWQTCNQTVEHTRIAWQRSWWIQPHKNIAAPIHWCHRSFKREITNSHQSNCMSDM